MQVLTGGMGDAFADERYRLAAPDAIAPETGLARGLRRVGALEPLRAKYYAITVERRLVHPAVSLIANAARDELFGRGRAKR